MAHKEDNAKRSKGSHAESRKNESIVDSCGCFQVVDACGCRVVDPCGCYVSQCRCC